jgi:hypothetical protein
VIYMITVSFILTVIAIVIILIVLFKLLGLISQALHIPAPWAQIIYWVIVLIVIIWLLGFFGIMQPIIR